jgi:hypothetical protein
MDSISAGSRRLSSMLFGSEESKSPKPNSNTYEDMRDCKVPKVQKGLFGAGAPGIMAGGGAAWAKSFKISTQVSFACSDSVRLSTPNCCAVKRVCVRSRLQ